MRKHLSLSWCDKNKVLNLKLLYLTNRFLCIADVNVIRFIEKYLTLKYII